MLRVHRLFVVLVLFATSLSAQISCDLDSGNERFRRGALLFAGLNEARRELVSGQYPEITILGCADSRVPPELVFDQTLGSVFVVRVAGNVADSFGLASLKYAKAHDYTKTLVVLGHQNCGAVKEAIDMNPDNPPKDPDLRALLTWIRAAIGNERNLEKAIKLNAQVSAKYVSEKLGVRAVAAYYSIESGKVEALP